MTALLWAALIIGWYFLSFAVAIGIGHLINRNKPHKPDHH